jgi:hypothetical protein
MTVTFEISEIIIGVVFFGVVQYLILFWTDRRFKKIFQKEYSIFLENLKQTFFERR